MPMVTECTVKVNGKFRWNTCHMAIHFGKSKRLKFTKPRAAVN